MDKQKATYDAHISKQARGAGARFRFGGEFNPERALSAAHVVAGPEVEKLAVYNEETFGPVVAVTTFKSAQEAVEKANRSRYGLLASIISRNVGQAEKMAGNSKPALF